MTAATAPRVVRFTASRDQRCGSPWTCDGVKAGEPCAYVGGSDSTRPWCSPCLVRVEAGEQAGDELPSAAVPAAPAAEVPPADVDTCECPDMPADVDACDCTSLRDAGFTLAGGWWVHAACGRPTAQYLAALVRTVGVVEPGTAKVGDEGTVERVDEVAKPAETPISSAPVTSDEGELTAPAGDGCEVHAAECQCGEQLDDAGQGDEGDQAVDVDTAAAVREWLAGFLGGVKAGQQGPAPAAKGDATDADVEVPPTAGQPGERATAGDTLPGSTDADAATAEQETGEATTHGPGGDCPDCLRDWRWCEASFAHLACTCGDRSRPGTHRPDRPCSIDSVVDEPMPLPDLSSWADGPQPNWGADPEAVAADLVEAIRLGILAGDLRGRQREIGPSEVGHPCPRALAYRLAGVEHTGVEVTPWRQRVGTLVHADNDDHLAADNERRGVRWLTNIRVRTGELYPGRPIDGTLDVFDVWTGTVIDEKVPGATAMRNYGPGKPEAEQYRKQVQLYARGVLAAGYRPAWIGVLRLSPARELSEYVFKFERFDEQVAIDALSRAGGIARMVDQLGPRAAAVLPAVDHNCHRCPWLRRGSTELTTGCPGAPGAARLTTTRRASVDDLVG